MEPKPHNLDSYRIPCSFSTDALGAYASSQGAVNSAANHVASTVFAFFATFGDAVSQAAQSFLPAVVSHPLAESALLCATCLLT